jgi:transposase-like protein
MVAYRHFPKGHWRRVRHSNLIERTFGETHRRVKVIGRLPGERSCLSLVWAVLDRVTGRLARRDGDARRRAAAGGAARAARAPVLPARQPVDTEADDKRTDVTAA